MECFLPANPGSNFTSYSAPGKVLSEFPQISMGKTRSSSFQKFFFFFFSFCPCNIWDLINSFPTRTWTWAPALETRSLNHWTTREVLSRNSWKGMVLANVLWSYRFHPFISRNSTSGSLTPRGHGFYPWNFILSQGLRMATSYFQGCLYCRKMIYYDGTIGLPGIYMVSPQERLEFLGPENYGDRLDDTPRAEPKGWRIDLLKILLDADKALGGGAVAAAGEGQLEAKKKKKKENPSGFPWWSSG